MMHNTIYKNKQILTHPTVNNMIQILGEKVHKDAALADDLLHFLNEHGINVPMRSDADLEVLIPVSFTQKNTNDQFRRLRNAFDGIGAIEQLL
jgi:aspartokinase